MGHYYGYFVISIHTLTPYIFQGSLGMFIDLLDIFDILVNLLYYFFSLFFSAPVHEIMNACMRACVCMHAYIQS